MEHEKAQTPNSPNNSWEKYSEDIKNLEIKSEQSTEKLKDLNWVKNTYGKGLDYLIDSLYKGDDNRPPTVEDYDYSMALEKIVPEEKQLEMVKRRLAHESVADDEVIANLSNYLQTCGLPADEIVASPFARHSHAENLAGRSEPNATEEFLWDMDSDFGDSTEAMSLLSDQDYLKKVYGANSERSGSENSNSETIDLDDIEKRLKRATLSGHVPLAELLNDPFLRNRHIASREGKMHDSDYPEEALGIWQLDKGFSESLELDLYERRKIFNARKEHPEIFTKVDQAEVDKITGEVMEKIPEQSIAKIIKLYEKSPYKADQKLLDTIAPFLGIDDNPPTIVYEGNSERSSDGGFKHKSNTIHFFHIAPEEKPGLAKAITNLIKPTITPKDEILKRIEIVTHEAWHAHQHNGTNVDEKRKQAYLINFDKYDTGRYCFGEGGYEEARGRYKEQLIEKEAWAFGKGMVARAEKFIGEKHAN